MRLWEFIVACVLIELTPGPNMSYLAALAMGRGAKSALQAVLGVGCGIFAVGALAAFGLAEFLDRYALAAALLHWGGVLFMLWLAVESWRDAGREYISGDDEARNLFLRGFVTNMLNPKLFVFYIAVMPDFVDSRAENLLPRNLLMVCVYTAVATFVHMAIIFAGGRAGAFVRKGAGKKTVGRIMAFLLLGVALWLGMETGNE